MVVGPFRQISLLPSVVRLVQGFAVKEDWLGLFLQVLTYFARTITVENGRQQFVSSSDLQAQ